MKAKQRALLLLTGLILLAAVALALLTAQNRKTEQAASEAADGTIPLAAVSADELTQIRITWQGETNTLEYQDGSWSLAEDPDYHLDPSACNTMLTALGSLNAKRELTPQAGEDYGLEEPAVTVEVTAAGQTDVYTFGDSNSVTGDLYLRKNGGETIYTVAGSKAACFEQTKADLFGAFNPAGLTSSAIEKATLTRADGESFTLRADSEPDTSADSADSADSSTYRTVWRLAGDPAAELEETKVNSLLSALSSYASSQITGEDPAAYGFDAPSLTAEVTTAEGTVTLYYAANADGCWMMQAGDSSVYAVDLDTLSTLLQTADSLKAE